MNTDMNQFLIFTLRFNLYNIGMLSKKNYSLSAKHCYVGLARSPFVHRAHYYIVYLFIYLYDT